MEVTCSRWPNDAKDWEDPAACAEHASIQHVGLAEALARRGAKDGRCLLRGKPKADWRWRAAGANAVSIL